MMTYSFSMKTFVQACLRNYVSTALPKTVHEMRGLALTLGTETAASPATHLRILRSSNHSSNKPYVVVNYDNAYLGGAVPYYSTIAPDTHCIEYIARVTKINGRSYLGPKEGDGVYDIRTNIINAFNHLGITATSLASRTSNVASNHYRVAIRITDTTNSIGDYHFWMENSSGLWSHKMGGSPSHPITDTDNPTEDSVVWGDGLQAPYYSIMYTSPTLYFSVANNHSKLWQTLTLPWDWNQ